MRWSEILFLVFFAGAVVQTMFRGLPARAAIIACTVMACAWLLFAWLARYSRIKAVGIARDWVPLGLVLVAYREMDLFARPPSAHSLEQGWQAIDRLVLNGWGLRGAIESLGWVLPAYFELTYLLVYGIAFFVMGVVYAAARRDLADRVLFVYLLGTLGAYALFPFFPSDPPRVLFSDSGPTIMTPLRRLNLFLVNGAGIHSSVFPSAHVSSAFSAAWAILFLLREKRREGWGMLIYAVSVAMATVYGRYHYAVDAVAGFGVSLVALAAALMLARGSISKLHAG